MINVTTEKTKKIIITNLVFSVQVEGLRLEE